MIQDPTAINRPIPKAATAIGAAAGAQTAVADQLATMATQNVSVNTWLWVHSIPWASLASIAAFVYTSVLLGEWLWKKFIRPASERMGWIRPKRRIILTESEWSGLRPRD